MTICRGIAVFFVLLSFNIFANGNDWVIRIKDKDGNIKSTFTVDSFKAEVSNFATFSGINPDYIEVFITNDNERWQFASQLIDQEMLYIKAVEDGYDKSDELTAKIEEERDRQIAQIYAQSIFSEATLSATEEEKRAYWNKEKSRIEAMAGRPLTYAQISRELEGAIIQEKMKIEYDKIIANAKTKYNLKYSPTSDPCITIEDTKIPRAKFDEAFNTALKGAGNANLNDAIKLQARDSMFNAFLAKEIMIYEARKSGLYDKPEAKNLENFITRSAVVQNYVEEAIRSKIEKSTKEEINGAYKQYGKLYNIDSLPYNRAQEALDTLVKETKAQNELKSLVKDLRYIYSIEKRLEILSK